MTEQEIGIDAKRKEIEEGRRTAKEREAQQTVDKLEKPFKDAANEHFEDP